MALLNTLLIYNNLYYSIYTYSKHNIVKVYYYCIFLSQLIRLYFCGVHNELYMRWIIGHLFIAPPSVIFCDYFILRLSVVLARETYIMYNIFTLLLLGVITVYKHFILDVNPLTAGAAYIRVFIFYQHIKYHI